MFNELWFYNSQFFIVLFVFLFLFKSSDSDEKGKFLPEPSSTPYFSSASFFRFSSNNLILKLTFLFSKSKLSMAQSILSLPVNLEGLASAAFIAIWDFFIWKSRSHPSGLTINPLLSVEIILTVIVWFIFLSLNQLKGSGLVCRCPTLTFCSSILISRILTWILSHFL